MTVASIPESTVGRTLTSTSSFLKGAGATPFSRGGDGRCALGPAIREYVMSEAMHALGIPTTRCLAVVGSGETVYRNPPQPGAIVTRLAGSHIRVGSFQYLRLPFRKLENFPNRTNRHSKAERHEHEHESRVSPDAVTAD